MENMVRSSLANAVKRVLKPLVITVGIVLMVFLLTPTTNNEVMAAGSDSQQGIGKMTKGGQGGQGSSGSQAAGSKGGAKGVKDTILAGEEDPEESDRPAWAGGLTEENPHMPADKGGVQPTSAGIPRGDDYGDLIVLVRNPDTGEPVLDGGELQVCLDVNCERTVTMVDGEIPELDEGDAPVEVDFGRASSTRSPNHVTDKALADALAKMTTEDENVVITLDTDEAGRIRIITTTTDPVTQEKTETVSTIDSPLENMALYIDLLKGLADNLEMSATEEVLSPFDLDNFDTAASLLAGVADKTGDISLDYIVYNNVIGDVVPSGSYYDYSDFSSYTRSYSVSYDYYFEDDNGVVTTKTLDINEYLEAINGGLPSEEDISALLFAVAADDALEVIELIHTQIHTEILPGTVEAP